MNDTRYSFDGRCDVCKRNRILVSVPRGNRLYTTEHTPNRKANEFAGLLSRIINLYA